MDPENLTFQQQQIQSALSTLQPLPFQTSRQLQDLHHTTPGLQRIGPTIPNVLIHGPVYGPGNNVIRLSSAPPDGLTYLQTGSFIQNPIAQISHQYPHPLPQNTSYQQYHGGHLGYHGAPLQATPLPTPLRKIRSSEPGHAVKHDAHLEGLKLIPDPPELEAWRDKLFNANELIVITEPEYVIQQLLKCALKLPTHRILGTCPFV